MDGRLLRALDRAFEAAAERAGERLACHPGCNECCHGPFPVTRLDAWRLQRGMAVAGSGSLRKRIDGAVEILSDGFPGDPATGRLSIDESKLDSFFELHAGLPCPVLDPASGRCELYGWRPVSCRTYGPPVLFGREKSPPCRLCFAGAPEEEIERCRIEPDRDDLEETILARLGVVAGEDWETLIPFALARLYTVSFAETSTDLEEI